MSEEKNSYVVGDDRGDRDPFPNIGHVPDTDLEDSVNTSGSDNSNGTENVTVEITDDTIVETKKSALNIFNVKNIFFAFAGLFAVFIMYSIYTAPVEKKITSAKSSENPTQGENLNKEKTKKPSDSENALLNEIKLLKGQVVTLQNNNEELALKVEAMGERLESLKLNSNANQNSTPAINENDLTTKIIATLLPEIKKHSDANAARIKKDLNRQSINLQQNRIQPVTNPQLSQVTEIKKPQPIQNASIANNEPIVTVARDLQFVMATTDLILVTALDDPTQRVLTLRPGELVKGRGVIKSISPRGCIIFQDDTRYEVKKREGACIN
jgi:hypothetical protein